MRFRTPTLFRTAVVMTAVGLWAPRSFAASEYVVVAVEPAADAPALGTLYKLGDILHVESGSTVTLMGDDGSVTALSGPADMVVTEDDAGSTTSTTSEGPSRLDAISDLLANGGGQVQSIGASRGVDDAEPSGLEPWTVPLEDGANGCIRDGKLTLWREPAGSVALSISFDDQPTVEDLIWQAGTNSLIVPGMVPASTKSATISVAGKLMHLALNQLPSEVSDKDNVALYAWMIGSGCALQASSLIRELASKSDPN